MQIIATVQVKDINFVNENKIIIAKFAENKT
jgi:hypothetical protein